MNNNKISDNNEKKEVFLIKEQIIYAFSILADTKFSEDEVKYKLFQLLFYLSEERVSNRATIYAIKYMANHITDLRDDFDLSSSENTINYEELAEIFMKNVIIDAQFNYSSEYGVFLNREKRKEKNKNLNYSSGCGDSSRPGVSSRCGGSEEPSISTGDGISYNYESQEQNVSSRCGESSGSPSLGRSSSSRC